MFIWLCHPFVWEVEKNEIDFGNYHLSMYLVDNYVSDIRNWTELRKRRIIKWQLHMLDVWTFEEKNGWTHFLFVIRLPILKIKISCLVLVGWTQGRGIISFESEFRYFILHNLCHKMFYYEAECIITNSWKMQESCQTIWLHSM